MNSSQIADLLRSAYAAELETVCNYLANSVWLDGLRAEEVKESLARDVTEELGHAKKLAHRMKQLGVSPPGSQALQWKQTALQPPADSTDLASVIRGVLQAETDAVASYKEIIHATEGVDHVTQDMAISILADEEGHRTLFAGFLKSLEKGG